MSITLELARAAADEIVRSLERSTGVELALSESKTVEIEAGWVFFYNSREFLRTGNPISGLAGNGPIFVDRQGHVQTLPSSVPWQEAIRST
jgi:Immunity protein 35